jgi:hypothetical protein
MRKIVPLLAAAGLTRGTAGTAHADPPEIVDHCGHPACGENCIGRGDLWSANWSTYTYSNQ